MKNTLCDPAQQGVDCSLKILQHVSKALCSHAFSFVHFLKNSSSCSTVSPNTTIAYWFSAYSGGRLPAISFSVHLIFRKKGVLKHQYGIFTVV